MTALGVALRQRAARARLLYAVYIVRVPLAGATSGIFRSRYVLLVRVALPGSATHSGGVPSSLIKLARGGAAATYGAQKNKRCAFSLRSDVAFFLLFSFVAL